MSDTLSASVFCFTPLRVPANEVDQLSTPLLSSEDHLDSRIPLTCSAPPLPTDPCPICPHLAEKFEPYRQAAYWKAQHQLALKRETKLQLRIAQLEAQLRLREQQLFGRKSETSKAPSDTANPTPTPAPAKKPRGQQKGQPGHGRRDHSHLPEVLEVLDLPQDQCCCQDCGQPFAPHSGSEETTILEIDVRAHRRVIRRKRYRPTCDCGRNPGIITAPPPPRLIPKSILGVSIWVTVLLDKYLFYRPTYRLLADLKTHDLDLPLGTLTDGLKQLEPLFKPLYAGLIDRNRNQTLWHADETRWHVFATVEGKVGYRWYLWVFHSSEVVVFVLAQGRSRTVPNEHLGMIEDGIMVVDRYKAYQAMEAVKEGSIILAFCWAHVRRDFLGLARTWPEHEAWALEWVEQIGVLYQLNDARLAVEQDPVAFAIADASLRQAVTAMGQRGEALEAQKDLPTAKRKVLESLGNHWTGLTVFVEHPEVPMDNNTAERIQRGPVVGRKNYYGSGAVWSGRLAAMLFSLFQTLHLWNINPRLWLTAYLQACAELGGEAPKDVSGWLPWNLTTEQRELWQLEDPPQEMRTPENGSSGNTS
jgi:transposase